jgi:ABC-type protease/lipase transport system fused ATPase/permease subunit
MFELSLGVRRSLALARAAYGWPALVVLDEPNSGLDETGDAALDNTLRALRQRQCTVVLTTHRASVLSHCDWLLVLQEGQVVALGPRDTVLDRLRQASALGARRAAGARAGSGAHATSALAAAPQAPGEPPAR